MRPECYREFTNCSTCEHVFIKREYEEGSEYFCNIDGSERPKCGSVFMKESFVFCSDDEYHRFTVRWENWSEPRKVNAYGCCSKHKESKLR